MGKGNDLATSSSSSHHGSKSNEPKWKMKDQDNNFTAHEKDEDPASKVHWKALFAFTTIRHVPVLGLGLLSCLLNGTMGPIDTIFAGRIFQNFTDYGGGTITADALRQSVLHNVLLLLALATVSWFSNSIVMTIWICFGELQARNARLRLFNGLVVKPILFYDMLEMGVSGFSPRLQTQLRELQIATAQPLGHTFQSAVTIIASLIVAFVYSWSLTLILLSTMPMSALFLTYISGRMQKHVKSQVEQLAIATKHSSTAFGNIETVKCYNGQREEYDRFINPIRQAAVYYVRQVRGNAIQMGYMKFSTLVTFMGGFYYASRMISTGKTTTANVITALFSCIEVATAVQEVLPQIIVFEKGRAAGAVLKSLIGSFKNDPTSADSNSLGQAFGDIHFQNVSFAYPLRSDAFVIKDLNCTFTGECLTFVLGRSGSGKSTLAQLLLRFYEPHTGKVSLNGQDLASINTSWLRANVTLVEQTSVLFHGTIFENIALGKSNSQQITLEEVKMAAEFALLTESIGQMSEGLDTIVGPKGGSVSGGQRQRIALARARVRDTPILILDESTSSLDQTSKALIMSAIRRWRKGKTTIIISHDVATVQSGDPIHLLEDGRLVASGFRHVLEAQHNEAFLSYLPDGVLTKSKAIERDRSKPYMNKNDVPNTRQSRKSSLSIDDHMLRVLFGSNPTSTRLSQQPFLLHASRMAQQGLFLQPMGSRGSQPVSQSFQRSQMDASEFSRFGSRRRSTLKPRPLCNSQPQLPEVDEAMVDHIRIFELTHLEPDEMQLLESMGSEALHRRAFSEAGNKRVIVDSEKSSVGLQSVHDIMLHADSVDNIPPKREPSLSRILATIWPNLNIEMRGILVVSTLLLMFHAAAVPLFSWIFSKMIATFYLTENVTETALKWSMALLGLSALDGLASYFLHIGLEYCGQEWVDAIRLRAMARILDQPKAFFSIEGNTPTQLAYNLDRNAEEMRNILGRFVAFFLVAVFMLLLAMIWSFTNCWKLTMVGFFLQPVSWALMRGFQVVSGKLEGQSNDSGEQTASILGDVVANIKTVRALTLESFFTFKHTRATNATFRVGIKRALVSGFFFGISQCSMGYFNCLVYFYGSVLAATNDCPVENIIFVFTQLLFALNSVTACVGLIPQVASSTDTAMRLLDLANLPETSHEHDGTLRPPPPGDIAFENVSFAYTDDLVLERLSLTILKGRTTAIVGSSGSGKSSIASLLVRLYPLPASRTTEIPADVMIGSRSIHKTSITHLRNFIALVPQTPVLFPASIAENISYGLPSDSPYNNATSIQKAAVAAGIDSFTLSLPSGYDTLIGDGGIGLSGGQAQRISIARALVREPNILILDEATSGLDGRSTAVIMATVHRLRWERPEVTVVIITHERCMMEIADQIVVIEKGRVVECGPFSTLMGLRQGKLRTLLGGGIWSEEESGDEE